MSSVLVTPRVAESALFGLAIGAAEVATEEGVSDGITIARNSNLELLIVRVPVAATSAIRRLQRSGALLCDTLLTLQRALIAPGTPPVDPASDVRMAVPSDAATLHAISMEAFTDFHGHWHADGRLAPLLATRLYAQWAADLALAVAASRPVLVALDAHGAISGFLALAERLPGEWHVPLAAVARQHRGRRLLSVLVRHALETTGRAGAGTLHYETQLSNLAAIRAVSRNGFVPQTSRHTFHLWVSTQ